MGELLDLLIKRSSDLRLERQSVERRIKNAPEGGLRVSESAGRVQYYHRKKKNDTEGKYIRKSNIELAENLAQKDYDRIALRELNQELNKIEDLISYYETNPYEKLLHTINANRKRLIRPIYLTDEEYIRNWCSVEYTHMGFKEKDPEFYTAKGERVRSKSEIMIADALNRFGIPYRYEYPIKLNGFGLVHPDFTCLNVRTRKEYIWEHFGMMGNAEYTRNNIEKINTYTMNGYCLGKNMIATFESYEQPIWTRVIENIIKEYLI